MGEQELSLKITFFLYIWFSFDVPCLIECVKERVICENCLSSCVLVVITIVRPLQFTTHFYGHFGGLKIQWHQSYFLVDSQIYMSVSCFVPTIYWISDLIHTLFLKTQDQYIEGLFQHVMTQSHNMTKLCHSSSILGKFMWWPVEIVTVELYLLQSNKTKRRSSLSLLWSWTKPGVIII